jgi:hypothetical protein
MRFRSPPPSESPSTTGASLFSKPSMPSTPDSEMDVDDPPKSLLLAATGSKKRAAESDSDESLKVKPAKRRGIAKEVYVQVPRSKLLARGKVCLRRTGCVSSRASFLHISRRRPALREKEELWRGHCHCLV